MDDKEKQLNLMRFWLFGTNLIVIMAVTVYAYFITRAAGASALDIFGQLNYWIIVLVTVVLSVVVYYVYKGYIDKQE